MGVQATTADARASETHPVLQPLRRANGTSTAPRRGHNGQRQAEPVEPDPQGQLAVKLLGLVRRVALEMRDRLPHHVEVDDLAGAGVLGLLDAVEKFDPRKHVKVETYARHRIRGAILDSLRSMDTASRDMRRKNRTAEKAYHELEAKLGRSVTDEEIAEALGISLKKWYRMVHELHSMGVEWMRPHIIPERPLLDEQTLADTVEEDQFDLCYRQEQREILSRAVEQLPERERKVVSLYYEQELTMKQIGETMGIDESRVSQLHSAAMIHLRNRVQRILNSPRPSLPPAFMVAGENAAPSSLV